MADDIFVDGHPAQTKAATADTSPRRLLAHAASAVCRQKTMTVEGQCEGGEVAAESMAVVPAGAKLGFRNAIDVRRFAPLLSRKCPTAARWSSAFAGCTTECCISSGLKRRSSMSVYQLFWRSRCAK
jgi:hypothetical protein